MRWLRGATPPAGRTQKESRASRDESSWTEDGVETDTVRSDAGALCDTQASSSRCGRCTALLISAPLCLRVPVAVGVCAHSVGSSPVCTRRGGAAPLSPSSGVCVMTGQRTSLLRTANGPSCCTSCRVDSFRLHATTQRPSDKVTHTTKQREETHSIVYVNDPFTSILFRRFIACVKLFVHVHPTGLLFALSARRRASAAGRNSNSQLAASTSGAHAGTTHIARDTMSEAHTYGEQPQADAAPVMNKVRRTSTATGGCGRPGRNRNRTIAPWQRPHRCAVHGMTRSTHSL